MLRSTDAADHQAHSVLPVLASCWLLFLFQTDHLQTPDVNLSEAVPICSSMTPITSRPSSLHVSLQHVVLHRSTLMYFCWQCWGIVCTGRKRLSVSSYCSSCLSAGSTAYRVPRVSKRGTEEMSVQILKGFVSSILDPRNVWRYYLHILRAPHETSGINLLNRNSVLARLLSVERALRFLLKDEANMCKSRITSTFSVTLFQFHTVRRCMSLQRTGFDSLPVH